MFRFVWPIDIYSDIIGLFGSERGEFHSDLFQMQSGNFFIQLFGEPVNTYFVVILPQIYLRQCLVGKRIAHHKRRMTRGTTQIDQSPLGQQKNAFPEGKVYLSTCGLILVCRIPGKFTSLST